MSNRDLPWWAQLVGIAALVVVPGLGTAMFIESTDFRVTGFVNGWVIIAIIFGLLALTVWVLTQIADHLWPPPTAEQRAARDEVIAYFEGGMSPHYQHGHEDADEAQDD